MRNPRVEEGRMFRNRTEAGWALAEEVARVVSPPCVVAAIPRGGVAVALPIVDRLHVPLAVAYARKLTAPVAPELAFGAIDEDGAAIIDDDTVAMLGLSEDEIEKAKTRVGAEIKRRMALYRVPPLAHYLPGLAVVLVDDGLATGLTMRAALAYARRRGATRVVVATPCASTTAAERFRRDADHFVSLIVDEAFMAVGQYYLDFSAVSDEQVIETVGVFLPMSQEAVLARGQQSALPAEPASGIRVSFTNSRGLGLAGRLLLPASRGPHPVAVFAHGMGSGKDSPRNRAVAEALCARHFAAFLFDFPGHGESEGQAGSLAEQVDDLGAALDVLGGFEEIDTTRVGVVGASSGAAVAIVRTATDARIRVLALRSANPEGAEEAATRITAPTLLVVGEHDEPIWAANEALLKRLGGPARLDVIPRGDHLFEDAEALRQATAAIVSWLAKYLRPSTF